MDDAEVNDAHGLLRDPAVRDTKLARLDEPHVRPLNDVVRRWRDAYGTDTIPWFDPDDGGVHARVLVLMEAPGPRTAAAGTRGFCSEDNDDPTAAILRRERAACGLVRTDYVRWNVVPWLPATADGRWRAPGSRDLDLAARPLADLHEALASLQLVVTVGRAALHGWSRHQTVHGGPVVGLLAVPHPSQRNTHARAESLTRLRYALRVASELANG